MDTPALTLRLFDTGAHGGPAWAPFERLVLDGEGPYTLAGLGWRRPEERRFTWVLPTNEVAAAELRFRREGGRWLAEELAGLSTLDGWRFVGRSFPLEDGRVLEVGGAVLYVVEARPPLRSPPLEASLARAPLDEEQLLVYADWLLERGDPLGGWMRTARPSRDDEARWAGALATAFRLDEASFAWRLGYARAAALGDRGLEAPDWARVATARLLRWPYTRHVESLTVRLRHRLGRPAETPETYLRWLLGFGVPPTLKALHLHAPARAARLSPVTLRQLADVAPWLRVAPVQATDRPALLTALSLPAGAELDATRLVLQPEPGKRLTVGTAPHAGLRLTVPGRDVEVNLFFHGGHGVWEAEDAAALRGRRARTASPLRVNGRTTELAVLFDGDVLEPVDGLRLRFTLEG